MRCNSICIKIFIFMNEYLAMEHMEKMPAVENSKPINNVYYLSDHPVIKESSTINLRVVFDESTKTTNNVFLK